MPFQRKTVSRQSGRQIQFALGFSFCAIGYLALAAGSPSRVWETRGFDEFRRGDFDSGGANLYVSRDGVVQTIHRMDVNNDGYPDLIFNNTHDLVYMPPAYRYEFRKGARQAAPPVQYPGAGAVRMFNLNYESELSREPREPGRLITFDWKFSL